MEKLVHCSPWRFRYRGYSIEECEDCYAVYNLANSMYDCHFGFKTVDEAQKFIDGRR